jgi:hypothetical protein
MQNRPAIVSNIPSQTLLLTPHNPSRTFRNLAKVSGKLHRKKIMISERRVTRSKWQVRDNFHNYHVELMYQRRTRRARSVFRRLALPTPVSISNGICSG